MKRASDPRKTASPPVEDKAFVIIGGTSGLGFSAAQALTRAGGKLAGGVQQIRFTMLSTNGNSGRAVYREFDLFGTESSAPLTEILKTTGLTAATSNLGITWRSYPGKTYRVEASEDLAGWNIVAAAFPSGGVTTTFWRTIQLALTPRAFFRVSTNP